MRVTFCPASVLADHSLSVKVAGTIYVSPTLWDLIMDANDRELDLLFRSIQVVDLDDPVIRERWRQQFGEDVLVSAFGRSATHGDQGV